MAQDMSPRKGARALHGRSLQGMAVLGGAVLLGSTFLSTPVTAQTVEELKVQISELSQRVDELQNQNVVTPMIAPAQAVTAGSFPGSIKLPGTNTSFKVSGYVKADIHWTTVQGLGDSFFAFSIPADGTAQDASDGHTRILARQTRFWIDTRTPSDFGQIRTMIQGDFFGGGGNETLSNSSGFRLRHAFGTIGNFMAGQTWSNFMILGALSDTVDFAGPAGVWFARQAQIRYTIPFEGGWKVELSAENPQATVIRGVPFGAASFSGVGSNDDQIPDFTGKVTFGGSWGFASLAALLGAYDVNTLLTPVCVGCAVLDDTEFFWAIHAGTRINTWGKDSVAGTVSYSEGGTRILYPFVLASAYVDMRVPGSPDIETIPWLGGNVSYEHWWADNLYSTAAFGITHVDYPTRPHPGVSFAGQGETEITVHANLQWQPASRVTLGIEYIFGHNSFWGTPAGATDDDGNDHRVHAMAKWAF